MEPQPGHGQGAMGGTIGLGDCLEQLCDSNQRLRRHVAWLTVNQTTLQSLAQINASEQLQADINALMDANAALRADLAISYETRDDMRQQIRELRKPKDTKNHRTQTRADTTRRTSVAAVQVDDYELSGVNPLEEAAGHVKRVERNSRGLQKALEQARQQIDKLRQKTGDQGMALGESRDRVAKQEHRIKELETELQSRRFAYDKQVEEADRLKDEMSLLSPEFFDEVEEMKRSLEKASTLNVEYEQLIKKLCARVVDEGRRDL